jgi:tRNA modification GTPase
MDDDTIAALSTPMGKGGIAVIRISGTKTKQILNQIVEKLPVNISPRKAYHSFIVKNSMRIDECILLFYKSPHSYTGEDLAEISLHSNPLIIEEVLNLILKDQNEGVRNALPGEFTLRAYKSGKMDLIQAESVNELINANSKVYAHMKFGSLEGKLSSIMKKIREDLTNLCIRIETKIEFEEDQYLEEISFDPILKEILKNLDPLLANARFNELLNKGLGVVITGKVNVGKSSLFNTLLMEERSIISATPGTTRDFIKEKLYLDGFPIEITDVAGFNRETVDDIETEGIRRSQEMVENADAVIFMLDASVPLDHADKEIFALIKDKRRILVANKFDIVDQKSIDSIYSYFKGKKVHGISVTERINMNVVTDFLKNLVVNVQDKETEFTVNQRQKLLIEELKSVLLTINGMIRNRTNNIELIAEEMRQAIDIIGKLMGEITTDDIINQIFSQFCVGK